MSNFEYTGNFEVDHDNQDLPVVVTFTVSKYYPATYLQPAEGNEVEIISIITETGEDITDFVTPTSWDRIVDYIQTYPEEFYYQALPDPDYLRDLKYD